MYRIESGASDKFVISPETGALSVAQGASLDPDMSQPRRTQYSLRVLALDGATGEQQRHTVVTVNITVLDVNNKPPVFIDPGTVHVKENTLVCSNIFEIILYYPIYYVFSIGWYSYYKNQSAGSRFKRNSALQNKSRFM